MEDKNQAVFRAIFKKMTGDDQGGWLVVFDVPDSESAELLKIKMMQNSLLQVAVLKV